MASILPAELLLDIFERLAFAHYTTWYNLHFQERNEEIIELSEQQMPIRPYAWVIVLQVCRWWRAVAVGDVKLWKRIVVTSFDAVNFLLRMSQESPLVVACHISQALPASHTKIQAVTLALTHRFRIETLQVRFSLDSFVAGDFWRGSILYKQRVQAPQLKNLRLIIATVSCARYGLPCEDWSIPRLFRVSVRDHYHVTVPYSLPASYRGVRELTYIPNDVELPARCEILAALSKMTALERVTVAFHKEPRGPRGVQVRPYVHLPNLRAIRLLCSKGQCADFLTRISFPVEATVKAESGVAWAEEGWPT